MWLPAREMGEIPLRSFMTQNNTTSEKPPWAAVFSRAMTVAGLVTWQVLPVSLLTPMANDLGMQLHFHNDVCFLLIGAESQNVF